MDTENLASALKIDQSIAPRTRGPGVVKPSSTSHQLVLQADLFATFAASDWKLSFGPGSGGWSKGGGGLTTLTEKLVKHGRSTPGAVQENDAPIQWQISPLLATASKPTAKGATVQ